MNRRAFLGALLGAGAVVATEAVAPSLIWPFRKYFLPSNWARWIGIDFGYPGMIPPGSIIETSGFTHVDRNGIWRVTDDGTQNIIWDKPIPDLKYSLAEEYVEAIELEAFAKEIPDLIYKSTPTWKLFKDREATAAMQQFRESVDRISLGTKSPMPMRLDGIPVFDDRENLMTVHGIARDSVPKHKQLLHKKATVENIVRFVDDLQSKS
jgi:hypothetical protein